jgi:hypothetical protein
MRLCRGIIAPSAIGSASSSEKPIHLSMERVVFNVGAFANQNAPIKVLPFRGSYALTTPIFDHFPRISCKHVCCSFGLGGAGIPYCRRANRLHFGITGTEEKAAGR